MGKLARSWELVKASWAVLQAAKELLIFPIVLAIAVITVMATFALPMFLAGVFDGGPKMGGTIPFAGIILGFGFYTLQYTVIFYCNSALVGAAMIRLNGGDPTIGDGFRIANKHFASIVGYALLSATVGIVLRNLAQRGIIGRLVASALSAIYTAAVYRYATEGDPGGMFDAELVRGAFRVK